MTTRGDTSDDKVGIMTALGFQFNVTDLGERLYQMKGLSILTWYSVSGNARFSFW